MKETTSGIYNITDQQNITFPVYCDFGSESGVTWTLIQSHSLQNKEVFQRKAFYLHDMPVNQDAPEWNNYRLSMSRMTSIQDVSTHWRATCNFPTDGVDYRDYWRVSINNLNLFQDPGRPNFAFGLSLSTSVEMSVPTAQFWPVTARITHFIVTVGLAH